MKKHRTSLVVITFSICGAVLSFFVVLIGFTADLDAVVKLNPNNYLVGFLSIVSKQFVKNPALLVGITLFGGMLFFLKQRMNPYYLLDIINKKIHAHLDQEAAGSRYVHYNGAALLTEMKVLNMSEEELAQRCNLKRGIIKYLLRCTWIIPHEECMAILEDGLMLPKGYFRTGKQFGNGYNYILPLRKRFNRYFDQNNPIALFLAKGRKDLSDSEVSAVVEETERQLRGVSCPRLEI